MTIEERVNELEKRVTFIAERLLVAHQQHAQLIEQVTSFMIALKSINNEQTRED